VKIETAGNAFRAQLIVPEQRQLYDYWLSRADGNQMPSRSDINPTQIPRLLSGISLVDVDRQNRRCRIRLAGTRLREIYDREVTGICIEDMDWGDKRDYWLAAYQRTIDEGKPTQGVLRGPRLHKEHVIQYWLKLPLRTTGDDVGMLLCYDYFMSASDSVQEQLLAAGGL
jgi:hypothetical protein